MNGTSTPVYRRYVAVGDSFTEGVGDETPNGRCRGWADLVAGVLSGAAPDRQGLEYANLAVRGKLLGQIIDDQLDPAIALGPDLVSFAGGGNDLLRPGARMPALLRLLDLAVARLADNGAAVVMFTGADPFDRLPMSRFLRSQAQRFCDGVHRVAERRSAVLVDLWSQRELRDVRYWAPDRLHLNPAGHRQVAARVLDALHVDRPAAWSAPVAAVPPPAHPLADRAGYYRRYVGPWVRRRLTGTSSGDGRTAKWPTPTAVDAILVTGG
jgi:lysophospholipase L1-like esterase